MKGLGAQGKQVASSRSEQKAARIDSWVKGHIAQSREAQKTKTSRLKALRQAHEALLSPPKPSHAPEKESPARTTSEIDFRKKE